jgi:hypothetical protein
LADDIHVGHYSFTFYNSCPKFGFGRKEVISSYK